MKQGNFSAHPRLQDRFSGGTSGPSAQRPAACSSFPIITTIPSSTSPLLEGYLPHLTVLINGIYWAPRYPRFVTKAFVRELYASAEQAPRCG